MRLLMMALTLGSMCFGSVRAEASSDVWEKYAPLMVTEIYAMSSPSDETVAELEARGKFLVERLGVNPNSRLLYMTKAIDGMVEEGLMRGTLGQLRSALNLAELLPSLPQDTPIPEVFRLTSSFNSLHECLRDAEFGQQAVCQAITIFTVSQAAKPSSKAIDSLKGEFLNPTGVYSTIMDLAQHLVEVQSTDAIPEDDETNLSQYQTTASDVTLNVMQAKRQLINAVLEVRKLSTI